MRRNGYAAEWMQIQINSTKIQQMIVVKKDANKIKLSITLSIGWEFTFLNERSSELDALLLKNQIEKDLNARIEAIRKEAYNKGWKEAKSKKVAKRTLFSGNINSIEIY